ncbi:CBS domain-containing protein [Zoogloeaceae bacterium G21618-S1]|jgi:CBS domain-containing protein|nr:CBS domain-containing protein [Zoogloeaceae bacterium G21618-S1]
MTTTVKQVLEIKGAHAHAVTPNATVLEALTQMAERDIGAVLVLQESSLVGIFTERDYARKVALKGLSSKDALIKDLMTPNVCTITPSHTIDEVMSIMTQNRFRHLPVVDHGKICGIITIGDVVKSVIAEHEATIQHLSSYISGDIAT